MVHCGIQDWCIMGFVQQVYTSPCSSELGHACFVLTLLWCTVPVALVNMTRCTRPGPKIRLIMASLGQFLYSFGILRHVRWGGLVTIAGLCAEWHSGLMDQQMAPQMFIELITSNMNLKTATMLWFYDKFYHAKLWNWSVTIAPTDQPIMSSCVHYGLITISFCHDKLGVLISDMI